MEPFLLSEKDTEILIRKYLKLKNFNVKDRKTAHGVDIEAIDEFGISYFIEVEGNKKPDGRPLTSSQKYTHFMRAIGQICMRMDKDGVYALGLPFDTLYCDYLRRTLKARHLLGLKTYMVYPNEIKLE
jgi:hypothetical protein